MNEENHKLASRQHFKTRMEERAGITLSKNASKAIKKKILTGEIPLWGFKTDSDRAKYLHVIDDVTYVIVYDKALGELVTIYPYTRGDIQNG